MKRSLLVVFLFVFASFAQAGVRADFISAVVKECKKSEADAKKMATGGRQGNVMKWKTCTSSSVTVDGCTLTCKDSSSKIGG